MVLVAITPTLLFFVVLIAQSAVTSITLKIGIVISFFISFMKLEAVLQAITIALTFCSHKNFTTFITHFLISSSLFVPYGQLP